jgi:hypothetical protein
MHGLLHGAEDLSRLGKENLASARQRDAPFRSVDELHLKLVFELAQLLAEARLADVAARRRAVEMQFLRKRYEAGEPPPIHGV